MVPFSIIFVGEFCVTIYKHADRTGAGADCKGFGDESAAVR